MTIVDDRLALLDTLHLNHGSHSAFDEGHCALELVSWLVDEPFSDAPRCVSPVIRAFVVNWNDSLPTDDDRDRLLKPLLPLMVGTATGKKDETTRAWMAIDWLVREQAPAWLRLAGLTEHAHALESLAALTGRKQAVVAQPVLDEAREAGAAAWDAAGDAAWAAAWDAAGDAAWAAAWAAARAAARDAAWDAAWAAAWDAAGDAARDAARAAARAAAWDAAGDAAWAAARAALEPTVTLLQTSAGLLVIRMCQVGR